jgi:hypothetical protein
MTQTIDNSKINNAYLVRRENLTKQSKDKLFSDIELYDFAFDMHDVNMSELIMFVDEDGNTKILKNRYGYVGNVNKH